MSLRPDDQRLHRQKLDQAQGLLARHGLEAWLTLVRETPLTPDPALDLILGLGMTWPSAFLVTPARRIAIVGRYDAEDVRRGGGFDRVVGYDEDLFEPLVATLVELDPRTIGLNWSESDAAADGLSLGLHRLLTSALAETPFRERLVSAEALLSDLRGCKTAAEIERLRAAIASTEAIVDEVTAHLAPGQGAAELADFVRGRMAARGLPAAWSPCPMVTIGPEAPVGHTAADDAYRTAPGLLVHMDLGVSQDGYVSDMQRCWYLARPGEPSPPAAAREAFAAVRAAILAAADALRPGARGWEVDAAARQTLLARGYPEYQHATGHHIGRSVHDGSTVLGPRWPRYGRTPEGRVAAGNVFTLELGTAVPGLGFIGLEEDVLVTEDGVEWLSKPQAQLLVVS